MVTVKDYSSPNFPTWCPGCGDYGIWSAFKNGLVECEINPHEVVIVYDIGCSGNMCSFLYSYGIHGLHGRAIPLAEGIKIANSNIPVIVAGGDGGLLGEGLSHFINACRGNPNITVVLHDNQVYGLTTGQVSPTADKGTKSKSTPLGVVEVRLNPVALSITQGATFVSRGFAGDIPYLGSLIAKAIKHEGFSVVDILQPCVTFNQTHDHQWYRERIYKLEDEKYTPKDSTKAYIKSLEWGDKIPVGIFYEEDKETYQDNLPQIKKKPLIEHSIENIDITSSLKEFI